MKRQSYIPVIVFVLVLITMIGTGLFSKVVGTSRQAVAPLANSLRSLGIAITDAVFGEPERLPLPDNAAIELEKLRRENSDLRTQLGFSTQGGLRSVGADVIGGELESLRSQLLLNAGTADGVTVGSPVIWDGYLIGIVREVDSRSCVVTLLDDPTFRVVARDLHTGAQGVLYGQAGLGLLLKTVPEGDPLSAGDVVVTAGLESRLPPDIPIGIVTEIEQEPASIFKQARIQPGSDLKKLTKALILVRPE